jgi:class 3 adenylate cyclase
MQLIADWLEKLGMSEYAERFAENKINLSALRYLTDQDLKDIGIPLGHRRIMLAAINELASATAAVPASVGQEHAIGGLRQEPRPLPTLPKPSAATEAAGERRHVTVMFCDLVDSTGIAARLDAEEWRDLVGAYVDAASTSVTEMGGKVAKKLGDGVMALFGYPVAQENDAERAVRAALAIQRSLADLNRRNDASRSSPHASRSTRGR